MRADPVADPGAGPGAPPAPPARRTAGVRGGLGRLALPAVLVSLAACLHALEGLLPPLPVPGARLGLANLVTTVTLYALGPAHALAVAAGRSLLGSLLSGKFLGLGFAMSLAGATVSALAMAVARAFLGARPVPTSTAGGLVHNLTQAGVAYLAIGPGILPYLPGLVVLGLLAGWVTGRLAHPVIAALALVPGAAAAKGPPPAPVRGAPAAEAAAPVPAPPSCPGAGRVRKHPAYLRAALAALCLLALVGAWAAGAVLAGDRRDLVVELGNREVARVPLDLHAPHRYLEVELPGTGGYRATIEVVSGRARILPIPEEYCPRGICAHTGWIERPGQAAICLPNRLVIRVVERPR